MSKHIYQTALALTFLFFSADKSCSENNNADESQTQFTADEKKEEKPKTEGKSNIIIKRGDSIKLNKPKNEDSSVQGGEDKLTTNQADGKKETVEQKSDMSSSSHKSSPTYASGVKTDPKAKTSGDKKSEAGKTTEASDGSKTGVESSDDSNVKDENPKEPT